MRVFQRGQRCGGGSTHTPLPQRAAQTLSHREETLALVYEGRSVSGQAQGGETDSPGVTQVSALPRAAVHLQDQVQADGASGLRAWRWASKPPLAQGLVLSRRAEAVGSVPGRAHKGSSNAYINKWTNKFIFLSLSPFSQNQLKKRQTHARLTAWKHPETCVIKSNSLPIRVRITPWGGGLSLQRLIKLPKAPVRSAGKPHPGSQQAA